MKPRQWLALFALSLPIVALSVDMNGVVVLLPSIAADLGVSAAVAGAIVTTASLAFAAPLLLIGRVADRVGSRPILLAGVVGFAIASAMCAVSGTFFVMIAGRALSLRGRWEELVRSKLAYTGVVTDRAIAEKWRALRDCPEGSWGRAVADFYDRHGFPFPGERFGIYELGARHDWVHVLAGYETTPEGELDVFAFIAASMTDERGLVLLAITLGLFQNGSIRHVSAKRVKNARSDTLTDDGAVDRWVEAFRRGNLCSTDVMGTVDIFAHKDEPLDQARARFGVVPVRAAR